MLSKIPEPVVQNIIFIHAASGCDTTSGLCGIGNCKLLKLLIGKHQLIEELELQVFYTENADAEDLTRIGFSVFSKLNDVRKSSGSWEELQLRLALLEFF